MPESLLRHGAWIAICDGQRALLLENKGDRKFPKLETRQVFKQENPPTHLQGSAPPGRAFSPMGGGRSAIEEPDFHDLAEQDFLRHFAENLDHSIGEHKIRALVLIAPARALGMVRPHLSAATRRVLIAELDRDYVKLPLHEVERHLSALS
jgi:protein required for attachment to host cells